MIYASIKNIAILLIASIFLTNMNAIQGWGDGILGTVSHQEMTRISNTIVSMHIALQSYNEIDGIIAYFRLRI